MSRQRLAKRLAWQQAIHDPRQQPLNRLPTLPMLRAWLEGDAWFGAGWEASAQVASGLPG